MDNIGFLQRMLAKGKINEAQHVALAAKIAEKQAAKEKYKAEKATLTKTQLQALLDVLTQ